MEAENSDDIVIPLEPVDRSDGEDNGVVESQAWRKQKVDGIEGGRGRGMRKKVANRLYEQFWRHDDDDGSDDDTVLH